MVTGKMPNRRLGYWVSLVLCAVLMGAGFWTPPPLLAAERAGEQEPVFSKGAGPIEVLIFADYYCPPCQKLEPYLDTVLPELLSLGVRVSFIDMPFSPKAPMFARYFLYAANAAKNIEGILQARRLLIGVAKADTVESDQDMIQVFKNENVALQFFDIRPVLNQWVETIKEHNVRNTPTCIVIKPGQEALRYIGSQEIPEGLDLLLQELSGFPKG